MSNCTFIKTNNTTRMGICLYSNKSSINSGIPKTLKTVQAIMNYACTKVDMEPVHTLGNRDQLNPKLARLWDSFWYRAPVNINTALTYTVKDAPKTIQDLIAEPWLAQPPDFPPANTFPRSMFVKVNNPNTTILQNIQSSPFTDPTVYYNIMGATATTIISPEQNFSSGDFELADPNLYIYWDPIQGDIHAWIFVQTTPQYWLKCCAGSVYIKDFCPTEYNSNTPVSSECTTLGGCVCGENSLFKLDTVCGCYPDYIKTTYPKLGKILDTPGLSLPASCVTSCQASTAFQPPNLDSCDLVICKQIINNQGTIIAEELSSSIDCEGGAHIGGGSGGSTGEEGSGGSTGEEGGGSTGEESNGQSPPSVGKNRHTILIAAIVGGSLLMILLIALIFFAM